MVKVKAEVIDMRPFFFSNIVVLMLGLPGSSAGILSPPLAFFIVMLPKAHLTSHSRMSSFSWVTAPSRLRNCRHVCSLLTGVVAVGAASAAKPLQSCPTLWNPIDGSPPGSPVPGILQARTREWVAISFSNACKWRVKVKSLSRVRVFATPRTAAHQAPLSMGFSRQEYWSGVPLPSPSCSSRHAVFSHNRPREHSHNAASRAFQVKLIYVYRTNEACAKAGTPWCTCTVL